jgi:hypothetical protein
MVFTLLVCSDVCNTKLNLEVTFPVPPTLAEIRARVVDVFASEVLELQRVGGLPRSAEIIDSTSATQMLAVDRMQIYDDASQRWADLVTEHQVHDFDQIYVFPRRRAHLDSRRDLPPPRAPTKNVPVGSTPLATTPKYVPRSAVTLPTSSSKPTPSSQYPSSASPSSPAASSQPLTRYDLSRALEDNSSDGRLRTAYNFADRQQTGYITLLDFRELFLALRVTFSEVVVEEMFAMHVQPTSRGYWNFTDFIDWARQYPTVFAAVHSRIVERERRIIVEDELQHSHTRLANLRTREEQLLRELEAVRFEVDAEQNHQRGLESELSRRTTHNMEEEEQVILDKEVRVQHQRYMLDKEERDLAEAAKRFDYRVKESSSSTSSMKPSGGRLY